MRFGTVPLADAKGGIVAHAIRTAALVLKKGAVIGEAELAALRAAGIVAITVAQLDPGDVPEDSAAAALAAAIGGDGVRVERAFTGRANLFAGTAGLLVVDKARIDALNAIDPDVTLATLSPYAPVLPGTMIATVKIIPFAIAGGTLERALGVARADAPLVRIAPYRLRKVGIIATVLPGLAEKVIDKTLKVTAARLGPTQAAIIVEKRVPHETAALAQALREVCDAGAELTIVFGASAITDRRDVIPTAIEASGGRVEHFGMPVDPGNLMLVAEAFGRPVLGAPGCARSPKENGFDWVLSRLLCGLPVTRADITMMGVGGLLMEIVTRPQPRAAPETPSRRVAAVVLAAGRSSRMGGPNKLLAEVGGRPLVRIAVEEALASAARPVIVVTGHQRERVEAALAGLDVSFVHNPNFAEGLSASLKAGTAAVPPEGDGAIICLGDMPQVDAPLIDRLLTAFDPERGILIVVPTVDGRRGNPVVLSRRFFRELAALTGDVGARGLIAAHPEAVAEVAVSDGTAFTDVDTPDALDAVRAAAEEA